MDICNQIKVTIKGFKISLEKSLTSYICFFLNKKKVLAFENQIIIINSRAKIKINGTYAFGRF